MFKRNPLTLLLLCLADHATLKSAKEGEKSNMAKKRLFHFSRRCSWRRRGDGLHIYSEIEANDLVLHGMEEIT
jgi:hypothetical protein